MFQTGEAIKTLPPAGALYRLRDNGYGSDYMTPFDVLTVNDCEQMLPVPESGSKIEAAPLRAAFRNFQKVRGRVVSTKPLPTGYSVDKIVLNQKNVTPVFGGTPSEIYYDNYSVGPRKMPEDPDITVDPEDYERSFYQTLTTPVSAGDEYLYYYAQAGYLNGCSCLSGTIWNVSMSAFSSWDGSYSDGGFVLSLDDSWIPSSEGRFTYLSCSGSSAMGILGKVCNFINSGLWSKITGNYNSIDVDEYAWGTARANAIGRIGIAAMDDCLREGL
jgi:hypothetical protein